MKQFLFLPLLASMLLATPSVAKEAKANSVEEIIVTARHREEALQDTPVAITVLNKTALENKGATNVGALTGLAPSLIINQQGAATNAANMSIRGIAFTDTEKSFEPTVGVVVDGVSLGTSTGQYIDLFDVDKIEVLRGPQGTMFGRNTIGGVINVSRTRPTGNLGVKADATYSSFNTVGTRVVLNLPEVSNISTKLFYFHDESDGWYRSGATGKRVGGHNNENYGASLLFTPNDNLSALLTVEQQEQVTNSVNSSLAKTGEANCALMPAIECNRNTSNDLYTVWYTNILGEPPVTRYRSPAVTLNLEYDFNGTKLTSISGYRKITEYQAQDFDGSSLDLYVSLRNQEFRQYTQELRLSGDLSDKLDYVVGGYFYDGRYEFSQNTKLNGAWLGGSLSLANAQVAHGGTTSYAVFGDVNYNLTNALRLNIGGRWTHDKRWLNNFFFTQLADETKNFSKFTPQVGIDYKLNDDTLVYASWSKGYRAGGYSLRATTALAAKVPFESETVDSYELGVKSSLFDNRLRFALAGFYSDYKNMQQPTTIIAGPTANASVVSNVGSARVIGLEGDFTAVVASNFKVNGSFAVMDNKFNGFIAGSPNPTRAPLLDTIDYSNLNMSYSPKFMASLNGEYTYKGITANVGYRYLGKHDLRITPGTKIVGSTNSNGTVNYIVVDNDPRVRQAPQHLVDASVSTKLPIMGIDTKLTVFGRNLLDERNATQVSPVPGRFSFGYAREPRTFGVSLGINF